MSFQDHLINDLNFNVFLAKPDGFGDPVTYTPNNGTPVNTIALADFSKDLVEDSRGAHAAGKMVLRISEIGLPEKGDTILLDSTIYRVVRILERDDQIVRVLVRSDLRGSYS